MRKIDAILVGSILFLTGCSSSNVVAVKGLADKRNPIPAGSNILVEVEPNASNPALHKEVKGKIEKLLKEESFVVDNPNAEYKLNFQLEVSRREETYYEPLSSRYGHWPNYDYTEVVPHVTVIWDQSLQINVSRNDNVIWSGEAVTMQDYPNKKAKVDYLLIALFEFFGQDTAGSKSITVKAKDPRITALNSR